MPVDDAARSGRSGLLEGDLIDIAAALAGIRDLQDEAGRTTFVHVIGEALGGPLLPKQHPSPKVHLYNVVAECRDRPGGMDALLRAVDYLAGSTHAAAQVRRLVGPAQEQLDPDAQVRIKEMLQGLTVPSLPRIYHAAAGDGLAPPPARLDDAWQAFSILLDANTGPTGLPPHLLLVGLLTRVLEREAAAPQAGSRWDAAWLGERLREWLADQLDALRAAGASITPELDKIQDEKELQLTRTDLPIYLIIQLEPLDDLADMADLVAGRRHVRLSHWRQIHPLEWRPERGEDQVVAAEQIPARVSELIQEAEGGWAYRLDDSLVLEFVLPLSLMHLAPDQWTRDPPGEPYPTPLGSEYEVIVRSYERLHTRTLHRVWRRRWKVLLEATDCLVRWPAPAGPADPELFRDQLMNEENVVGCVLSCPPDRDPGYTELRMALRAGLPVLVWDRGATPAEQLREALREVIERPDLRELPGDVKRLRAGRPPNDYRARGAASLTLLYDNPDHFLTDIAPLRPPRW